MIRITSMSTLGSRIARYRKDAGLTQGQLAKRCGWASQSRVGNYENDSREPTLGDLKKIASVLGIHVLQLIDEKDPSGLASPASVAQDSRAAYGSPASSRLQDIAAELNDDQLKLLCGIAELIRKG